MATLILKATHLYMSPKKHGFVYPWIMNVTLFSLLKLKPSQSTGGMCNLKVRKSSCWTDLWARPDQVQLSFFRPGLSNLGISGISGGGWVDLATQSAWGQVALTIALWFSVKPHKPSRFVFFFTRRGNRGPPRCQRGGSNPSRHSGLWLAKKISRDS